jgi:hypothetical protein
MQLTRYNKKKHKNENGGTVRGLRVLFHQNGNMMGEMQVVCILGYTRKVPLRLRKPERKNTQ